MILFFFLLIRAIFCQELEGNTLVYNLTVIDTVFIDLTLYDALKLRTDLKDAAVVVYTKDGIDKCFCDLDDDTVHLTPDSIFYIWKPQTQFILIKKKPDVTNITITIAYTAPFMMDAEVGYICADPYDDLAFSAFYGFVSTNIAIEEKTATLFHASPVKRNARVDTMGLLSSKVYYNDNGVINHFNNPAAFKLDSEYNYLFTWEVGSIRRSVVVLYRFTLADRERDPSLVYDTTRNLLNKSPKKIELHDLVTTNSICLCLGNEECNHCPPELPRMNNIEANLAFTRYANQRLGSDLYLYVDGTGNKLFPMIGFQNINIHIEGLSETATLELNFEYTIMNLVNITNLNIDFSPYPMDYMIQAINFKIRGSNIRSGKFLVSLVCDLLEADFPSIANIYQIRINKAIILRSESFNSTSSIPGGVFLSELATLSIKSDLILMKVLSFGFSILNWGNTEFTCKSADITSFRTIVIGEVSKAPLKFVIDSSVIEFFGAFGSHACFLLTYDTLINSSTSLPQIITDQSSNLKICTTGFMAKSINIENIDGSVTVPCDDIINKIEFVEDYFRFYSNSKSITSSNRVTVIIDNNNKRNYLRLVPPKAETIEVKKRYKIYLRDGSTTYLQKGWRGLEDKTQLVFIPENDNFQIISEDSNLPETLYTANYINGTPAYIRIYPAPTPTKNLVVPISLGTTFSVVFIILVVFLLTMTPVGNWLGLTTYGPYGKTPKKYDFDDDDDAGIEFSSSETLGE